MEETKREKRRQHDADLKVRVLACCAAPGASVAKVAMEHGLNANLVHRWRRIAEGRERSHGSPRVLEQFVPLPIASRATLTSESEIRIEVRRGALLASVHWPVSAAAPCAAWLRELLR
jgi:transposase